ncbi:hypothetical protein NBRC10512_000676 [Rhodotorula toruloides]|uniref:RHTO0S08e01266g1_1 n=2 Tax=Rhodotorula toruloides TaxID=5286 RepID=A0A061B916_RHOTO|nr:Hap4 transcription factor, heteromerization domain containing protein [Rhodotorula toruloides NP11]EMS20331.1 Hap4 transcription factor, heteromerisation domain containing protein [Rhodotorula toruloides NP11]CDR43390.1 RHTO0S08e01266g1_1 [Rhodotorula toruloides]
MPPRLAVPPAPALAAGPSVPVLAPSRSEPKPLIKASKEWVVPPRPKPGRKSAKVDADTPKKTGKNSQKAFRERRQEYVTELEEKVRRLEAGEGEKCVFYQQQAQKAKVESQQLWEQNVALKREIEALKLELAKVGGGSGGRAGGKAGEKGKARAVPDDFVDTATTTKRPRRSAAIRAKAVVASATSSSPPEPAAVGTHSPVSAASPDGASTSHCPHAVVSLSPSNGGLPVPPFAAPTQHQRCTFCSGDANCFCAEVGYEVAPSSATAAMQIVEMAAAASPNIVKEEHVDSAFNDVGYEPAVPLRLRRSQNKPLTTVWAIESSSSRSTSVVATPSATKVVCSGDPANCPACSDDPFGKAFCNALSSTVCSTQPCANCPSHATRRKIPTPPPESVDDEAAIFESFTDLPCCKDPALCGSLTCKPEDESHHSTPASTASRERNVDTVPCNEAWTQLKQHPNIGFADLQMLADVVAKRTYCDGPVASTPPPPPGVTSETFPASSSHRPMLVPQSALQCSVDAGTRRRLTVERGAVNEALSILDKAAGRGGPLKR